MAVHEGFIVQLFVYKLVLGYIDLLIGKDLELDANNSNQEYNAETNLGARAL